MSVTAEAAVALKELVLAELGASAVISQMVEAFGGEHRCYERFLLAEGSDIEQAAARFKSTVAFRQENGLERGPRRV